MVLIIAAGKFKRMQQPFKVVIKKALEDIVKINNVNVIGSGRTDSGVHSLGQVCSVKLKTNMTNIQLLKALNSKLPNNIRVTLSEIVDDNFNARFSAVDREYIYKIKKGKAHLLIINIIGIIPMIMILIF